MARSPALGSLDSALRRQATDEDEIFRAEIRLLGALSADMSALPLPQIPTHVYCSSDRALRPLIAMRWPENANNPPTRGAASSDPGLLHVWDSRSSAATPLVQVLVEGANGRRPLLVVAAAIDSSGACIASSADGAVWTCGPDGAAVLLCRMPQSDALSPSPSGTVGAAVVHLACGGSHTLACTRDGRLFAWGSNSRGQLGMGDDHDRALPTRVELDLAAAEAAGAAAKAAAEAAATPNRRGSSSSSAAASSAAAAASPRRGSTGMRSHASSVRTGAGAGGIAIGRTQIHSIAAASAHSLAVSTNGVLFAWGDGGDGRLGVGETEIHGMQHAAGRRLQQRHAHPLALPPPPPPSREGLQVRELPISPCAPPLPSMGCADFHLLGLTCRAGDQSPASSEA